MVADWATFSKAFSKAHVQVRRTSVQKVRRWRKASSIVLHCHTCFFNVLLYLVLGQADAAGQADAFHFSPSRKKKRPAP
jgi:hypothetical protein